MSSGIRRLTATQADGTTSFIDREVVAGASQVGPCCVVADVLALPLLKAPADAETATVHVAASVVHVAFTNPVPVTTVLSAPLCSICTATTNWSPAREHLVVPLTSAELPAGLSVATRSIASATVVSSVDS